MQAKNSEFSKHTEQAGSANEDTARVRLPTRDTLILFGVPAAFFVGIVALGLVTQGEAPSFAVVLLIASVVAAGFNLVLPNPERSAAAVFIFLGLVFIVLSGYLWFHEALTEEDRGYQFFLGAGIAMFFNYLFILLLSYSATPMPSQNAGDKHKEDGEAEREK